MYRPFGYYADIGDVEIIERGGVLNMFHLVIPNRDLVAHAVSEDGLTWRRVAPAIRTGDPGAFDDDMIRTVSVTRRGDEYVMLYSATSERDGGGVERTGCAVSKDLLAWEKVQGYPIVEPCPAQYEARAGKVGGDISWRDPKPFYENGVYYCLWCGRTNVGPAMLRGCAALAESSDLIGWQQKTPLFFPSSCYAMECPQLYKIGDKYYLIASLMEDRSQRYWMADHLYGPYVAPPGGTLLFPPGTHYAARLANFAGRDALACWTFALEDGPSPFGLKVTSGAVIKYVPALLEVRQEADGRLSLATWHRWDDYAMEPPQPVGPWSSFVGAAPLCAQGSVSFASPGGMSIARAQGEHENFALRATLRIEGDVGGLVFHGQPEGYMARLELEPQSGEARLILNAPARRADGNAWFSHRVLASRYIADGLRDEVEVLLRSVNGEIEVSIGGKVQFSTVSTALTCGFVGLFAQGAAVWAREVSLQRMRAPAPRYGSP